MISLLFTWTIKCPILSMSFRTFRIPMTFLDLLGQWEPYSLPETPQSCTSNHLQNCLWMLDRTIKAAQLHCCRSFFSATPLHCIGIYSCDMLWRTCSMLEWLMPVDTSLWKSFGEPVQPHSTYIPFTPPVPDRYVKTWRHSQNRKYVIYSMHCCRSMIEPQATCTENILKFWLVVFETVLQTRQTYIHADCNTHTVLLRLK